MRNGEEGGTKQKEGVRETLERTEPNARGCECGFASVEKDGQMSSGASLASAQGWSRTVVSAGGGCGRERLGWNKWSDGRGHR